MGLLDYDQGWGQGANAFANNFMKTYLGIQENQRANAAKALQEQVAKAQMREILAQAQAREDALRKQKDLQAEMAAYENERNQPVTGLMSPLRQTVTGNLNTTGLSTLGNQELLKQPIQTTYRNKAEADVAAGKNPESEYLKGALSIVAKYDPEKAIAIREKLHTAQTNSSLREALLALKKAKDDADIEAKKGILDLREKYQGWLEKNATNKMDFEKLKLLLQTINKPSKLQQSSYVDEDGTPLLFNPNEGQYQRPDGALPKSTARRLPSETVTSNATFETLKDTAESILKNPNRHSYVGPVDSLIKKAKAGSIGDAEFTAFRTKIEQLIETSYALSGKQISEREIKMLEKLRGSLGQPDESFDAAMQEYVDWVNNKITTRQKVFKQAGYSAGENKLNKPRKPLSAF